jgi:hypothetical protein
MSISRFDEEKKKMGQPSPFLQFRFFRGVNHAERTRFFIHGYYFLELKHFGDFGQFITEENKWFNQND